MGAAGEGSGASWRSSEHWEKQLLVNQREAAALADLHDELRSAVISRFGLTGELTAAAAREDIETHIENCRRQVRVVCNTWTLCVCVHLSRT